MNFNRLTQENSRNKSNKKMMDYMLPNYNMGIGTRGSYFDSLREQGIYLEDMDGYTSNINVESYLKNGRDGNMVSRPVDDIPQINDKYKGYKPKSLNVDALSGMLKSKLNMTDKEITEKSYNRFEPLVPELRKNIQSTSHIIPKYWVRGGMDTRAMIRDVDYLKACGLR